MGTVGLYVGTNHSGCVSNVQGRCHISCVRVSCDSYGMGSVQMLVSTMRRSSLEEENGASEQQVQVPQRGVAHSRNRAQTNAPSYGSGELSVRATVWSYTQPLFQSSTEPGPQHRKQVVPCLRDWQWQRTA